MDRRADADYRFGEFKVDATQRLLFQNDHPVAIPPKVFDVLLALIESHGRVVQKQDLLDRVWPGTFVEEANLSVNISALRKVLGDGVIETIPKRGYRFVAPMDGQSAPPNVPAWSWRRWALAAAMAAIASTAALAWYASRPFSIAVLPFANPNGNPVAGSLAETITEGVTDRLSASGIRRLRVTAHSLVAKAVDGLSPVAAGRQLGVDAVVSGQLVERNGQWTVRAECIEVANGSLLWSDDYTDQTFGAGDIAQREIASEVAAHLPIRLSAAERDALDRPMTRNAEAQKLVERVELLFYQATPESLQRSLEYSHQALKLDPGYVMPYGDIASIYSLMSFSDIMDPHEAHARAVEWQAKAIAIDNSAFISHIALLGEQATFEWDWQGIGKAGLLHPFYRDYLIATGRVGELLDLDRHQAQPDPRHALNQHYLAMSLYYARQYDEAVRHFAQSIEIDPGFLWSHLFLGSVYEQQGKYDDAIREFLVARPLKRAAGSLGHVYARSGRREDAQQILDDLIARGEHEYVTPLAVAKVYLGLGDTRRAFAWMQKACDRRVPELIRVRVDPIYDPVRADPRFSQILECVGVK